jgi:pimeloyl-ACP methyl ester carboxylesterase
MSTFVLVHGAWRGGWLWKRVRRALQEQGHEVFTPALTGAGERSHLLSKDVNLDTHIKDVVNLVEWEDLSDIILCGHSYGGCVVTGAADRIADRIAALVYLDAFVPDNGQCLHDTLPPEARDAQVQGAKQFGEGWKVPPITATEFNVNLKDREMMDRKGTMQSLATFQQPLHLTGAIERIKDVTYVLATGWAPSPFPQFYEKAKARGWKTLTLDCGHDVMLDRPEEVVKILVDASSRVGAMSG